MIYLIKFALDLVLFCTFFCSYNHILYDSMCAFNHIPQGDFSGTGPIIQLPNTTDASPKDIG